jgi:hypothetical protein
MNNQNIICLAVELKIILASDADNNPKRHHLSLSAKPSTPQSEPARPKSFKIIRQNRSFFDAPRSL